MEYNYIKVKVEWYPEGADTPINMVDTTDISTRENFEPTNNKCTLVFAGRAISQMYESNVFKPQENDRVVVYVKKVVDNVSVAFDGDDVIWTGKFVDLGRTINADSRTATWNILDYEYDVFARFHKKAYSGLNLRTPFVLADMIKEVSEDDLGTGEFKVNFKYVGYPRTDGIQVTRPNGGDQSSIEFVQSDIDGNTLAYQNYTALAEVVKFPVIEPTMINKPTFEWVQELSSSIWTNSETEQANDDRKATKNYVFRISNQDVLWYYPLSNIAITIDGNSAVLSTNNQTQEEGSVNFLILEAGEDFNGEPIFTYIIDQSSTSTTQKERYDNQVKLAGKNTDYDNDYHSLRLQYTVSTNTEFRAKVRELAQSYAEYWFRNYGRGKQENTLTIPFTPITINEIVRFQLHNFPTLDFVIKGVNHNISRGTATTTLNLEEDIEE